MATVGSQADFVTRLRSLLPNGWFADDAPVLNAVLNGAAYCLALLYGLIAYAKLQTRIATATDGFLDLVSFDYFGALLMRRTGETDASLRIRIFRNLLREKATRHGIIKLLTDLTGQTPVVFEPWRPLDCGAYGKNICGYGVAGGYGSVVLPYQAFITCYDPIGQGVPFIAGYGNPEGAFNTGSQTEYASPSLISGLVTDADLYAAVADAKVEGTIAWMQITNNPAL
jgi:hypothetical protein